MSWHFGNQFENPPSCCKLFFFFFFKVNFLNQVCGMVLWRGGGQGGVWERKKGVGGGEGRGAIVSGRVERQEPGPPRDHPDRRSNTTTSLPPCRHLHGGADVQGCSVKRPAQRAGPLWPPSYRKHPSELALTSKEMCFVSF